MVQNLSLFIASSLMFCRIDVFAKNSETPYRGVVLRCFQATPQNPDSNGKILPVFGTRNHTTA
jgi:hypothetical protein